MSKRRNACTGSGKKTSVCVQKGTHCVEYVEFLSRSKLDGLILLRIYSQQTLVRCGGKNRPGAQGRSGKVRTSATPVAWSKKKIENKKRKKKKKHRNLVDFAWCLVDFALQKSPKTHNLDFQEMKYCWRPCRAFYLEPVFFLWKGEEG